MFSQNIRQYAFGIMAGALILLPFQDLQAQTAQPDRQENAAVEPQADNGKGQELAERQSAELLSAIDEILSRAAEQRAELKDLPSRDKYVIPPLWGETREGREENIRALLDSVLEIVTDAPIVQLQSQLQARRDAIAGLRDEIAQMRERRLRAPEDGFMPGILSDTQSSIEDNIADLEKRIASNEEEIGKIRGEIKQALLSSGVEVSDAQLDLLLDSVLGGDLIKLVTAFQAARAVDDRLGELLKQSNEDVKAARRYFAMHASLFALMVHAQDIVIEKIDKEYVVKLQDILKDIEETRVHSRELLRGPNRDDQERALDANVKALDFAEKVASFYRDYLLTQREQLVEARERTLRDLDIADNTFDTVEASFQLHALMKDARTSFDALQRLEAPGFDQVFKNESLRKEFESLTQKLRPTS